MCDPCQKHIARIIFFNWLAHARKRHSGRSLPGSKILRLNRLRPYSIVWQTEED